jgi:hypothetical protein
LTQLEVKSSRSLAEKKAEIERIAARIRAEALAQLDDVTRNLLGGLLATFSAWNIQQLVDAQVQVRQAAATLLRSGEATTFAAALEQIQLLGAQAILEKGTRPG